MPYIEIIGRMFGRINVNDRLKEAGFDLKREIIYGARTSGKPFADCFTTFYQEDDPCIAVACNLVNS